MWQRDEKFADYNTIAQSSGKCFAHVHTCIRISDMKLDNKLNNFHVCAKAIVNI